MSKIEDIKLMVKIAEMHYRQDMTQQEIADQLNISRTKVFRYLRECIEKEIVTININDPFKTSSQLEAFFKNRYSLTDVIITPDSPGVYDYAASLKNVGAAAARYLSDALVNGCTLGVEWGLTAYHIAQAFSPRNIQDVLVVQLLGCSYQSQYNTERVITEFAHKLNTVPFTLPFPVIAESIDLVNALMKESRAVQIYGIYKDVDIALLTVGKPGFSSTISIEGFLTREELDELKKAGAVADICGRYLDIQGNICLPHLYKRAIGINFEEIRNIKLPILVACGDEKAEGIIGALNGGLCKALVTDEHTANQMMKMLI